MILSRREMLVAGAAAALVPTVALAADDNTLNITLKDGVVVVKLRPDLAPAVPGSL